MSDGVTIGASSAPSVNPNVLMELFGSAESVQTRVQQYQKAKTDAEAALAALKLGKDAKAAYDDAAAKQVAGADALKNAQDKVSTILADAKAKSDAMLADTAVKTSAALSDVEKQRKDHSSWVESQTSDVTAKKADAKKALADANAAKVVAEKLQTSLDQKIKDAEAAAAAASAQEKKFKEATERLQKSIADQIGAAYAAS